jgi:hypothetical protein
MKVGWVEERNPTNTFGEFHISYQPLRIEFWGYTNKVRLRGLDDMNYILLFSLQGSASNILK